MKVSAIPDLVDALVALAEQSPDLADATVSDGYSLEAEQLGDVLMIGVEDPELEDAALSATSSTEPTTMGIQRSREELGTITCMALSANGDGDPKAARDRVFAMASVLADATRANPSLGVAGYPLLVTIFGSSQQLMQQQDDRGAWALLAFQIGFRARL